MRISAALLLLFYLISVTNSLLKHKLCKFKFVGYDFRFRIVAMFKLLAKKYNFVYVVRMYLYDLKNYFINQL